jgi:predicted phosphodiesterase
MNKKGMKNLHLFLTIFLVTVIATSLIASTAIVGPANAIKKSEKKVLDKITTAMLKASEGKPSTIKMLNMSKNGVAGVATFWNTTKSVTPPPPPPPVCKETEHLENNKCVPNPPPPKPGNFTVVDFVGDIKGSSVRDAVAKHNPNIVFALGDLTYDKTVDAFKSGWYDYFVQKGVLVKCTVGNHDSDEEEKGQKIVAQAIALCGDSWWLKVGHVLFLGYNTNGNIQNQLDGTQKVLNNQTIMSGVTHIVSMSHKNGHVPDKSHHPVEAAKLYAGLESMMTHLYEVNAHNHFLAKNANGFWFISGGGARSHYECATGNGWSMCNNTDYGFLEFKLDKTTGDITANFYDTSGNELKK